MGSSLFTKQGNNVNNVSNITFLLRYIKQKKLNLDFVYINDTHISFLQYRAALILIEFEN